MNGLYEISNLGRVKSLPKTINCWNGFSNITYTMSEKILAQRKRSGYLVVGLTKDNKQSTFSIHRLVAEAFISNPKSLPCVNHKDEDKTNNCVDNLEWCNYAYNNSYGSRTKRTCRPVKCIETGIIYDSTVQAGKSTGINRVYITNCCNNKRLSAGGYHWEYIINDLSTPKKIKKDDEEE